MTARGGKGGKRKSVISNKSKHRKKTVKLNSATDVQSIAVERRTSRASVSPSIFSRHSQVHPEKPDVAKIHSAIQVEPHSEAQVAAHSEVHATTPHARRSGPGAKISKKSTNTARPRNTTANFIRKCDAATALIIFSLFNALVSIVLACVLFYYAATEVDKSNIVYANSACGCVMLLVAVSSGLTTFAASRRTRRSCILWHIVGAILIALAMMILLGLGAFELWAWAALGCFMFVRMFEACLIVSIHDPYGPTRRPANRPATRPIPHPPEGKSIAHLPEGHPNAQNPTAHAHPPVDHSHHPIAHGHPPEGQQNAHPPAARARSYTHTPASARPTTHPPEGHPD